MKKGFVFINGYGLVKFNSQFKGLFSNDGCEFVQYQGLIKLPKGVSTCEGEKWVQYDHWFTEDQIFETKKEALLSFLL